MRPVGWLIAFYLGREACDRIEVANLIQWRIIIDHSVNAFPRRLFCFVAGCIHIGADSLCLLLRSIPTWVTISDGVNCGWVTWEVGVSNKDIPFLRIRTASCQGCPINNLQINLKASGFEVSLSHFTDLIVELILAAGHQAQRCAIIVSGAEELCSSFRIALAVACNACFCMPVGALREDGGIDAEEAVVREGSQHHVIRVQRRLDSLTEF